MIPTSLKFCRLRLPLHLPNRHALFPVVEHRLVVCPDRWHPQLSPLLPVPPSEPLPCSKIRHNRGPPLEFSLILTQRRQPPIVILSSAKGDLFGTRVSGSLRHTLLNGTPDPRVQGQGRRTRPVSISHAVSSRSLTHTILGMPKT